MAEYTASIEIGAPPSDVFPFLFEPDRLRQWLGGFVESRPLTSGPVGVGTKSIDVLSEGGREVRLETEIVVFEPGRRVEVAITGGGMKAVSVYTLEGTERALVTHRQTVELGGMLKLMGPLVGRSIRQRMTSDLAGLKAAVEGG